MDDDAARTILVIEDDFAISELVRAILTDEGYVVSVLNVLEPDAVRVAVNQLEPDCVLLDSANHAQYGLSWEFAAWAHARGRPVPVVMFTAHPQASREAEEGKTERARAADFSAVISKPFDIDTLIDAVARSVGRAVPFDLSPGGETGRSEALRARLEAAGAADVEVSRRREWATFQVPDGSLIQLYWWQRDGVYYVVRVGNGGPKLLGRFHDLDAALGVALTPHRSA